MPKKRSARPPHDPPIFSPAQRLAEQKKNDPDRHLQNNGRYGVMKTELLSLRKQHQLTLEDVAFACGIGVSALCKIEQGREPLVTTAYLIAKFYGLTVEAIWKMPELKMPQE